MVRNGIWAAKPKHYKPRKDKPKETVTVATTPAQDPDPAPKPAELRSAAAPEPTPKHQLDQVAIVKRGKPPVGRKRVELDLWGPDGRKMPAITLTSMGLRIEGSSAEMQALITALQTS